MKIIVQYKANRPQQNAKVKKKITIEDLKSKILKIKNQKIKTKLKILGVKDV